MPARQVQTGYQQLSPRSKGVRQGALIMLSTILLVPLISILSVFLIGNPQVLIPVTAITCFVGGLIRILYALMMEDANPPLSFEPPAAYAPMSGQVNRAPRLASLPPPPANTGLSRDSRSR